MEDLLLRIKATEKNVTQVQAKVMSEIKNQIQNKIMRQIRTTKSN